MADILIIGGGVSGLSAGIYGLLSGHSVTVCEKNAVLCVFKQKDLSL